MLINCVAYQNGMKLGDIPLEEISDYIAQPDCFVWVALRDPELAELKLMQEEFGLHELAVEDAGHGHQRPKIEEYGKSLFVVLPVIELDGTDVRTGELAIFADSNFILSVRRNARQGFTEVRRRTELEPELLRHGSAYVLYALMDAVVDRYFPVIEALSEEIEAIEKSIHSESTTRAGIERIFSLKQRLMVVKRTAGPLLEASGKLHGGRVPHLCAGLQDYFRDVHDHLVRLNDSIDNLRDTLTTVTSITLAFISLQESEVTKRLAAYAALVAVPTLVAGVYGMNFEHMPELKWVYGYPLAIAFMVIADVYLFLRFRKAKWL